jgi:hypothetical protein
MKSISKLHVVVGLSGCLLLLSGVAIAQSDYNSPDTSGNNTTAHGYYQPPANNQPSIRPENEGERERREGTMESPTDRAQRQVEEQHRNNPDAPENKAPEVAP